MRSGGSGGGLPHAGEVRLGLPRPTGCAAREQASARALYVRMMCARGLWPVWAIDAVRRAASAARSLAAGRLCIRLYWVCGCIRFFTISYRADLSRPLHDDTCSQSNLWLHARTSAAMTQTDDDATSLRCPDCQKPTARDAHSMRI